MKTVVKELAYEKVLALSTEKIKLPKKPGIFWRWLIKTISIGELKATHFSYKLIEMEKLGKKEPCLILMNHSCFTDLQIAETIMFPRPLNIICTSDGFVGKNWLMRQIGCIPTNKFVSDVVMVKHMKYALEQLKSSVLMYPEASYSFDGTATPLPASLGKCLKILKVPVVMIRTYGAFMRNPLYNNLQLRKVDVSADVKYLLSPDDIQNKSVEELNEILADEFNFDNWKWQQENNIKITENFRADCLNRVLYKCPCCYAEGKMEGKGTILTCKNCSKKWELSENGYLEQIEENENAEKTSDFGDKRIAKWDKSFSNIPEWFKWERQQVKEELMRDEYKLKTEVEIYMMVNKKAIYHVGSGLLIHDKDGFVLDGCEGKLHYEQKPKASYSLYSDYYWYEIGDMICIGDMKTLYYCFPKTTDDIVAKARIATEELYKMS